MLTACRLGDSETRFKSIDKEFEAARESAKDAKDAFMALKKQRCELFTKAYNHISNKINLVYQDLTKGKSSPQGGVAYLTLEDSDVRILTPPHGTDHSHRSRICTALNTTRCRQ